MGAQAPFMVVPGLLGGEELARLRDEARGLRASASRWERTEQAVAPDGHSLCRVRSWYATGGEASQEILRMVLRPRLAVILGGTVVATHATYLYYGYGDFLGLHRDHPSCAVTVLVWLAGPAGDLRLHPELAGAPDEVLVRLAEQWDDDPPGCTSVDLRQGSLIVRGSDVPHNRPPHPYADELVIAAFCFIAGEEPMFLP